MGSVAIEKDDTLARMQQKSYLWQTEMASVGGHLLKKVQALLRRNGNPREVALMSLISLGEVTYQGILPFFKECHSSFELEKMIEHQPSTV